MKKAPGVVRAAASIRLDISGDVLAFSYVASSGEKWEGCVDEWIGNRDENIDAEQLAIEIEGQRYYQIGASGGGADMLLVRDDELAEIYYLKDYDGTLSLVSPSLKTFIDSLRPPV